MLLEVLAEFEFHQVQLLSDSITDRVRITLACIHAQAFLCKFDVFNELREGDLFVHFIG